MIVNSGNWISAETWFENFSALVSSSDFEPAAAGAGMQPPVPASEVKCPAPPVFSKDHSSASRPDQSRLMTDAKASLTPAAPPCFPPKFKTSLLVNISQPGYDGGNVFINFTQDCSKGPAKQISHTIFGNFHNVLLNCSSGLVHSWDAPPFAPEPFNCQLQDYVASSHLHNLCDVCGLPFSVGSTGGKYTTSAKQSEQFQWEGNGDSYSGVQATRASKLTMDVHSIKGTIPQGSGHETPEQFLTPGSIANAYSQRMDQVGWQRTLVHFSPISTDVSEKDFDWRHYRCFKSSKEADTSSLPAFV